MREDVELLDGLDLGHGRAPTQVRTGTHVCTTRVLGTVLNSTYVLIQVQCRPSSTLEYAVHVYVRTSRVHCVLQPSVRTRVLEDVGMFAFTSRYQYWYARLVFLLAIFAS